MSIPAIASTMSALSMYSATSMIDSDWRDSCASSLVL